MALPVHFYDFWGATLFVLICDSFSLAKTITALVATEQQKNV